MQPESVGAKDLISMPCTVFSLGHGLNATSDWSTFFSFVQKESSSYPQDHSIMQTIAC